MADQIDSALLLRILARSTEGVRDYVLPRRGTIGVCTRVLAQQALVFLTLLL